VAPGASNPVAPARRTAATSSASTKSKTAAGSTNRRISQAVAVRFTRIRARVTHFIVIVLEGRRSFLHERRILAACPRSSPTRDVPRESVHQALVAESRTCARASGRSWRNDPPAFKDDNDEMGHARAYPVNGTATAWLIRRFVDPAAVLLFVDADEVAAVQ